MLLCRFVASVNQALEHSLDNCKQNFWDLINNDDTKALAVNFNLRCTGLFSADNKSRLRKLSTKREKDSGEIYWVLLIINY